MAKQMLAHEVRVIAVRIAGALGAELATQGVSVPDGCTPAEMLRLSERTPRPQNRRLVALHNCLHAITTTVLQRELRAEMRARTPAAWRDVAFSPEDDKIGDEIRALIVGYLKLKERVFKRDQARMDAAKAFWAPGTKPIVEAARKYRDGLTGLVAILGEFDPSFGASPRTTNNWSRWQVVLELGLHEGGLRDAEIAKLFGRSSTQVVANARARYRKALASQPT
jgi:hypothetical protein